MSGTHNPTAVGAFILSGFTLGIAIVLLFGASHLFTPTVHAVTFFEGSVANLDVGAPVTFRGVRVGTVTQVAVTLNMKTLTARIPVYFDVNPTQISLQGDDDGKTDGGFDRLLKAGLRTQLNMQSLITGQLRIDLDILPGTPATIFGGVRDRTEISSVPSKLQTIEDEISALPLKEMSENANQALASIRQAADSLAAKIDPMADSFHLTSEAARVALVDIDALAIAGQHQLASNGNELTILLKATDRTMHDTDALVASLRDMTDADAPMRVDMQATMRDLSASASALREFTHTVEQDPRVLLLGRSNP